MVLVNWVEFNLLGWGWGSFGFTFNGEFSVNNLSGVFDDLFDFAFGM